MKHMTVFVGIVMLFYMSPIIAEKTEPGLYTANSIGISGNPLGLVIENRLFQRWSLFSGPGLLREGSKFELGIQSSWTPTDEIATVKVTLEPIAFFSMSASAGFYGLFTAFGFGLLPFESTDVDYSPVATKDLLRYNATGGWVTLTPELRLKAGRVIVVNACKTSFIAVNRAGFFLEMRSYAIHRATDVDINNEANVLIEINKHLLSGCVYRLLNVFGADIQSHRLDAIAIGRFPNTRCGNLFAVGKVGYYFADPAFGGSLYAAAAMGMEARISRRGAHCKGE
jgi:hypothetical protein